MARDAEARSQTNAATIWRSALPSSRSVPRSSTIC
jgi:hypothetical protein